MGRSEALSSRLGLCFQLSSRVPTFPPHPELRRPRGGGWPGALPSPPVQGSALGITSPPVWAARPDPSSHLLSDALGLPPRAGEPPKSGLWALELSSCRWDTRRLWSPGQSWPGGAALDLSRRRKGQEQISIVALINLKRVKGGRQP